MNTGRVLVVEDNPSVGRMEADVLRAVGYDAQWTPDGTAVETMHLFQPDVVVLDLAMPEIDGVHIAEEMRADDDLADVPIVIASGMQRVGEAIDRIGTPFVVVKPFDIDELVEAVDHAVHAAAP